ncbi:MAG: hypothetical protein ABIR78_11180 [Ferruginibacter sp.]
MKKFFLPFLFIGSIVMIVVMAKTGTTLKTPATPMGILDLEFAYNAKKTTHILNAWAPGGGTDNIAAAKINTYWDFLFLFFYAGFLFLACKKIASAINGPVAKAGNLIAKAALLAGVLDILENAGMLLTLNGQGSNTVSFCTTCASVIKWGLAIIAVLYVLTGLLVLLYRRIKY